MKFTKTLSAIMLMVILAGCMGSGESPTTDRVDTRYVGVFIPQQDPTVDQQTAGKNADQYFMPLWKLYERGRINGATANVHIFLQDGDREVSLYNGSVEGFKYFPVNRSQVTSSTLLCVKTPWSIIAHQRVAAGENIMCEAGVNAYFAQGNGRTAEDAWGVIAIAPAGF